MVEWIVWLISLWLSFWAILLFAPKGQYIPGDKCSPVIDFVGRTLVLSIIFNGLFFLLLGIFHSSGSAAPKEDSIDCDKLTNKSNNCGYLLKGE